MSSPRASGDEGLHPLDAWWTVLVIDPLAIPLVRVVAPWRVVTPMRLTVAAHLLGIATAALFALGAPLVAAVLYEVRFVIDCMDGKLARRRNATSAVGAYADFVGDYLITAANFLGVGLWLLWDGGVTVLVALAPPVVFLAHMAVRLSTEMQGSMRRVSDAIPGRYVSWMAEHRLVPAPVRVDVEHAYLFVLPAVAALLSEPIDVQAAGAVVVSAYFGYVLLRFLRGGLALARAKDAGASPVEERPA